MNLQPNNDATLASVRRAAARDVAALVALRAEMFDSMGVDGSDGAWRDASREWFNVRLDDTKYGIFVVEVDGVVVASAVGGIRDMTPSPACPKGRDILISSVCTFPDHRGRGYGSAA